MDFPRGSGSVLALHESMGRRQLAQAPCVTVAFAKQSRDMAAEPAPGDLHGAISARFSALQLHCCNLTWHRATFQLPHAAAPLSPFCFF